MLRKGRWMLLMSIALLAAACSGPAGTTVREAPAEAAPGARTVEGFRIQILTTPEKPAADARVEEAVDWWQGLPEGRRPSYLGADRLFVNIKWRQPYYRVHLGRFASREEAEQALAAVAERFPDALIVPETVTLTR